MSRVWEERKKRGSETHVGEKTLILILEKEDVCGGKTPTRKGRRNFPWRSTTTRTGEKESPP